MFKVNKNEKAFKELESYAKSQKMPIKQVLLSDEHLEKVCDIFYSHMPKMVKFAMKKDKFTEFYKAHREQFVESIKV